MLEQSHLCEQCLDPYANEIILSARDYMGSR